MDFTVIQLDTGCNLIHISFCHILICMYVINLLFQELRMSQLRSQVTVIRQQQYTCSVAVQTTYRINTLITSTFHQIHYRAACLRIIRGSHSVFRLIQQDVDLTFDAYRLIVEFHFVTAFNLGSEFCNHCSVY